MRGFAYAQQGSGIRLSDRRHVDIVCEVVAPGWDVPIRHRCTDLSTRGMWLHTSFPLGVGEVVVICMEPRGWRLGELMVFARVERRAPHGGPGRPRGMGLGFLDLRGYEREEIARLLRREVGPPKMHWDELAARLVAA
ncbi:MAG: PilZ domain-containing protein [Myxococcales bacterium]|nr:PilZ domain-containing protein [Myxococcales bacterium]